MFKSIKTRGFTLIELLVVIAIIGILASVVLASLNDARATARDARRMSDIKQLQTALELYRNNNNNQYPAGVTGQLVSGLTGLTQHINPLPQDPTRTGSNGYRYSPGAGRTSYTLLFMAESTRTNGAGIVIPANNWCNVTVGVGHASWNGVQDGSETVAQGQVFPSCF